MMRASKKKENAPCFYCERGVSKYCFKHIPSDRVREFGWVTKHHKDGRRLMTLQDYLNWAVHNGRNNDTKWTSIIPASTLTCATPKRLDKAVALEKELSYTSSLDAHREGGMKDVLAPTPSENSDATTPDQVSMES